MKVPGNFLLALLLNGLLMLGGSGCHSEVPDTFPAGMEESIFWHRSFAEADRRRSLQQYEEAAGNYMQQLRKADLTRRDSLYAATQISYCYLLLNRSVEAAPWVRMSATLIDLEQNVYGLLRASHHYNLGRLFWLTEERDSALMHTHRSQRYYSDPDLNADLQMAQATIQDALPSSRAVVHFLKRPEFVWGIFLDRRNTRFFRIESTMEPDRSTSDPDFMQAGIPEVVATLWQVKGESTGIVLGKFYDRLRVGQSPPFALSDAKRTYLEEAPPNRAFPSYWAGAVVYH